MIEATLSDPELRDISAFLYQAAGISLAPSKKALVSGRLGKRLQATGCRTYAEYLRHIRSDAAERQHTIDLLTTNETYFFREPKHFAYLSEQVLPKAEAGRPFRVWSAACSSGEEPYSISMVLAERLGWRDWQVVGSDISTRILQQAREAIFPMERAEKIPPPYLKAFCLKGTGAHHGKFTLIPELRERVQFREVNLNSALPDLGLFDMIWLRNVMIYFDAATKRAVCQRLLAALRPGGFFFIGHSESLNGLDCPLQAIQPAIYRKP